MFGVCVTFENVEQMWRFCIKLIRDFRCTGAHCNTCKDANICKIMIQFIDELRIAELKFGEGENHG